MKTTELSVGRDRFVPATFSAEVKVLEPSGSNHDELVDDVDRVPSTLPAVGVELRGFASEEDAKSVGDLVSGCLYICGQRLNLTLQVLSGGKLGGHFAYGVETPCGPASQLGSGSRPLQTRSWCMSRLRFPISFSACLQVWLFRCSGRVVGLLPPWPRTPPSPHDNIRGAEYFE
jgi:hypothetical protein